MSESTTHVWPTIFNGNHHSQTTDQPQNFCQIVFIISDNRFFSNYGNIYELSIPSTCRLMNCNLAITLTAPAGAPTTNTRQTIPTPPFAKSTSRAGALHPTGSGQHQQ
jgi:hypothetical protein